MPVESQHPAKRFARTLALLAAIATLAVILLPAAQLNAAAQASDQPVTITIINEIDGTDPGLTPKRFAFRQQQRFTEPAVGFELNSGESFTYETSAGQLQILRGPEIDWAVTQVDCGSTASTLALTQITIDPAPGAQVTCTFTSQWQPPARVSITKAVTAGGDDTEFLFRVDGSSVVLKAGETRVFRAEAGSFSISEFVAGGWKQSTITCPGPSEMTSSRFSLRTTLSFPIAVGDSINCTSTSEPAGPSSLTVSVATVGDPAGATTAFVLEGVGTVGASRVTVRPGAPVTVTVEAGSERFIQILTETPGWQMIDFVCDESAVHSWSDDDDTTVRPSMNVAVLPEADVSCTITNSRPILGEPPVAPTPAPAANQLRAPTISVAPAGPAPGPFDPIAPIASTAAEAEAAPATGVGGGSDSGDEVLGTTLAATGAESHTAIAATLMLIGACFLATSSVTRRRSD